MRTISKTILMLAAVFTSTCGHAQERVTRSLDYDPAQHKLIPDKAFEIGIPALLLLLLLNTIVAVLKNKSDARIKQQLIDRGATEETLIAVFRESNALNKLQPLRYAIYGVSLALSFILIHLLRDYLEGESGYLAVGIILLFTSAASYSYYRILQRSR